LVPASNDKITVQNFTSPDHIYNVDRAKYETMRKALMAVLPANAPGLTVAEAHKAVVPHLDSQLFPGGAKAGWWLKCVQLDLEAKKVIERAPKAPVRLFKVSANSQHKDQDAMLSPDAISSDTHRTTEDDRQN
jgi:hypothetical protein